MGLAAPATNLPTWWMRIVRSGSTITSAYSLTDPEGAGGANWVALSGSPNIDTVMPTVRAARVTSVPTAATARSRLATTTSGSRPTTPVDRAAPTTSHTLAPAAPDGANGWYRTGAQVTLAAGDEGECVSGVDRTELPRRRRRVRAVQRAVQRRR